ncbi:MAG TPA: MraY family glycosyltransferase [Steroidobacteraceae bacterium]|jgi:UDP-GlcNAc:undecaprenyl-phosphate GlcNAc-1-phosphate transferase|nr:MraY family glycosyltransferase [Steroidobacteraceae bacterium]
MQILFASLLAMGMTVMFIPLLMQYADRLGVLDRPGGRRVHARPIPRVGGIAMAIGMLCALMVWGSKNNQLLVYCVALLILLAFGIMDDRMELSPKWKLLGQVTVALVIMIFGHVSISSVHHLTAYDLPVWLSWPVTLIFIVGITNAINLADGLDGLAGGTTLLCFIGLALLGFSGGSDFVAFASVIAIGAVLGFLRYNTHPARIFMGDAGSQLLGFSAAVLSLVLTQDKELLYSASLPLFLLGVPVIDTLMVMIERILDGKSPFQADRNHIHHRLLSLGFQHNEAVIIIYGVQSLLLVMAWHLRYASDLIIVSLFVIIALGIVVTLRIATSRRWQWRALSVQPAVASTWLQRQIKWLYTNERLNRSAGVMIGSCIVAYGAVIAINGIDVPVDIRVLAAVAAMIVLIGTVVKRAGQETGWLERAALYTSVLIAVYLDRTGAIPPKIQFLLECAIFGLMISGIVIRMLLKTERRFRITPLDVLVLIAALALPNLPGSLLSGFALGTFIWKTLVLFYAVENLSTSAGIQWRLLTGGTLMFLSAVALRAAL